MYIIFALSLPWQAKIVLDTLVTMFSEHCDEPFMYVTIDRMLLIILCYVLFKELSV